MKKMPVLFISHGPPSILLMDDTTSFFLKSLAEKLPPPRLIVCVSAHWETDIPTFTGASKPDIIYDFGGPPQLFNETYLVNGSPEFVKQVLPSMEKKEIKAKEDIRRGLDHGAWVPLKMIYPKADIPVVQLSIQTDRDTRHHFNIGNVLQNLREQGVLIIGSGGAVHNLYEIQADKKNDPPFDYVRSFNDWLYQALMSHDTDHLLNYVKYAPEPERSHPFPAEHFLPLFVCLGAGGRQGEVDRIHSGYLYRTLSMDAYRWD